MSDATNVCCHQNSGVLLKCIKVITQKNNNINDSEVVLLKLAFSDKNVYK